MKAKYPLTAAAVSVALANAAAHSIVDAANSCTPQSAAMCAVAPPPSTDNPEHHPEAAIIERARGEQEPVISRTLGPQTITMTSGDRWPYNLAESVSNPPLNPALFKPEA